MPCSPPTSLAAAVRDLYSRVRCGVLSDVYVTGTSRPSVLSSTLWMAHVAAWWPLGYSGWGGVALQDTGSRDRKDTQLAICKVVEASGVPPSWLVALQNSMKMQRQDTFW